MRRPDPFGSEVDISVVRLLYDMRNHLFVRYISGTQELDLRCTIEIVDDLDA